MADVDILKGYKPRPYPTIEGGVPNYVSDELQRISTCITLINSVLKSLEDRIVALGG